MIRSCAGVFTGRERSWCVFSMKIFGYDTVKTRMEEKCARTLELPLLVRSPVCSLSFVSTGG